jgi:homoserine dehydrogenase
VSRRLRLALVGFGSVGRRFVEGLAGPFGDVLREEGVRPVLTGVATARHGIAAGPEGRPPAAWLDAARSGSLAPLHRGRLLRTVREFIRHVEADALVEVTTLDPRRGEPATTHARMALDRGLHVVTANKGPVAFAHRRLRALAARRGVLFLHEGAVMDGAPVFNLVERCLPGVRVLGFRGTLNATTGHVLAAMEDGRSATEAVREMQAQGIAEADATQDLDGWDAAVKGCALANALMGGDVRPRDVRRTGIRVITRKDVSRAARAGRRIRLVTRGRRHGSAVALRVAPEALPLDDPLAAPGTDSVLILQTDLMGEVGILERAGTVDQTAYALLSDLVAVARALRARR